jgi:hypothetical protein
VSHLLSSKKKHGWTLIISGTQKNNVGSSVPPDGKIIDLLTKSVFFGRYWSVFLCIYHTDTEGKLGQYCWYQKFGGSPSKNWREPPFSQEGGGTTLRGSSPAFLAGKKVSEQEFRRPHHNHLTSINSVIDNHNDGNVFISRRILGASQNQEGPPNILTKGCANLAR